jgi:hypothetical protein
VADHRDWLPRAREIIIRAQRPAQQRENFKHRKKVPRHGLRTNGLGLGCVGAACHQLTGRGAGLRRREPGK